MQLIRWACSSYEWFTGRTDMLVPGKCSSLAQPRSVPIILRLDSITPLLAPVVPEVKMIRQVASGSITGRTSFQPFLRSSSSPRAIMSFM